MFNVQLKNPIKNLDQVQFSCFNAKPKGGLGYQIRV